MFQLRNVLLRPYTNTVISTAVKCLSSTSHIYNNKKITQVKEPLAFPGPRGSGSRLSFTHQLNVIDPDNNNEGIPVYQVIDEDGNIVDKDMPKIENDTLIDVYKKMILLNLMDKFLYESQRQGRISFYMTCYGEEGTHFGSATALDAGDLIFGQYREQGVLMWRGFSLDNFMSQCYANSDDIGKGRQMPVHYGSKDLNFVTISSPLATQMPQASGAAYAFKRAQNGKCVVCYFGEGAASEGDAHAAINFAATLNCPVIFFCRNNGFAISTPVVDQYRGDGIAARASGYGMPAIRVDGNDFFAVHKATKLAREIAVNDNRPVILEAMTYRVGHHSTSDDSAAYRKQDEVQYWRNDRSPVIRLRMYLEKIGIWNEEKNKTLERECRIQILESLKRAEKMKKPSIKEGFLDVYDEMPLRLQEQYKECMDHIAKYSKEYPVDKYAES